MSEFEKKSNQRSYDEKITEIASKIAINKYNVFQGKNINLEAEISGNIDEVNTKINQVRNELEQKVPGLGLPKNINDTIAEYLLHSIDSGISDISQLANQNSVSDQIFKDVVLPNSERSDVIACMKRNDKRRNYESN